jgi:hypothetical protein
MGKEICPLINICIIVSVTTVRNYSYVSTNLIAVIVQTNSNNNIIHTKCSFEPSVDSHLKANCISVYQKKLLFS